MQKRGAGAAWSSGAVPSVEGRRPSAAAGLLLRGDTPRDAGPGKMVAGTDAAWSWNGLVLISMFVGGESAVGEDTYLARPMD